jgi:hypothetical protein
METLKDTVMRQQHTQQHLHLQQHIQQHLHQNTANMGTHRLDDGYNNNERNISKIYFQISDILITKYCETCYIT